MFNDLISISPFWSIQKNHWAKSNSFHHKTWYGKHKAPFFQNVVLIKEKCTDVIIHSRKLFKDGGSQDAKRRSLCKSCDFEKLTIFSSIVISLGINLNPIDLKKCLFCKGTKCTFSFFYFLLAFCFPVTWHDQISFHMHIWLCYYRVRMPWRISTLIGTYGGEAQRKAFRRIFGAKNDFPLLLHSPQLELLSLWMEPVCRTYVRQPVKIQNHSPLLELRFWMGASLREK